MFKLSPILPCLALGLAGTAAHAQVFFSGSGSTSGSVTPGTPSSSAFSSGYGSGFFPDDGSLPGSTSGSATFTANDVSAVGSASGSYTSSSAWSGLTTSANASHNYPTTAPNASLGDFFGFGGHGSASSYSYLNVQDLVFSGPSAAIPISLNLLFSGTANANSINGSSYGGYSFSISLGGAAYISGSFNGSYYSNNDSFSSNTGLLSSYAGGLVPLQSGVLAVPTGVPLTLRLSLYSNAGSSGLYDTSGSAAASSTLALPTSGPVFNLPGGFSVDSVSLGLVNNSYSAVPEPEHYAALAGFSLLGFAVWRRRCTGPVNA